MSNFINTLVNTLNGYLWGPIMIVLCLGVAIIYSVVFEISADSFIQKHGSLPDEGQLV